MRTALVLFLLAPALLASESTLAERFPAGATAYVEVNGLAQRLDQALASPLAAAIREHPAVQAFWSSPQGRQVAAGRMMLQGATGLDLMGIVRAVASKEMAVAFYGGPQSVVAMARVDPVAAERILLGVELFTKSQRVELLPAEEGAPALWQLGRAYGALDGDLLVVSTDRLLATSVRSRAAKGLASGGFLASARSFVDPDSMVFAAVDLRPFAEKMRLGGKPKDLAQALLFGALSHYVPDAPWAAVGLDIRSEGGGWSIAAQGVVPVPEHPDEAVTSSYSGTLGDLPFALPETTVGLVRLKRSLASIWSHRDALLAEAALPKLVEFETNFGNITGGMSWVEEFLPAMGDEMILLGTRHEYGVDERSPAVRYPQGALLVPVEASEDLKTRLQVAYFSAIGIVNIQQGQMKGTPMVPAAVEYRGVRIQTARFMAPEGMDGGRTLPVRYNFSPSMAVVDGYLVLASTETIVKEIIDGRGETTPAPLGVNAGAWLRPAQVRTLLAENRESLVASRMLNEGEDRAGAEKAVDLALELARYLRSFSVTVDQSRAAAGVTLKAAFGPAGE